jgi:hypothetical protein
LSKEEIYEGMQEIKFKIVCMSQLKSDAGENVDFGFYLIMTDLSNKIDDLSKEVDRLGETTDEKLSELFVANK